jgi:hypothetical protein
MQVFWYLFYSAKRQISSARLLIISIFIHAIKKSFSANKDFSSAKDY